MNIILALISALITFFTAKKKGNASDGQAAALAAAAGAGTYYVTTQTEWGQSAVSALEGWLGLDVTDNGDGTGTVTSGSNTSSGQVITGPNGETIVLPTAGGTTTTNAWDVLKSWGATGTATLLGTGALVTGRFDKILPWLIGGGILLLLTR